MIIRISSCNEQGVGEEPGRKWRNRSCKICAEQEQNKKYATKYDRLAQELCAVDRDKDSRAERDKERGSETGVPSLTSIAAVPSHSLGHVIKVAKPELEDFRKLRKC